MTLTQSMTYVSPRPRSNAEELLQRAVVQLLAARKVDRNRFFAVPNGEKRGKATAGRLKAQGVLAGVPDLVFILSDGRIAFIELKARNGRLSPAQSAYMDWCVERKIPHAVCASIDDVDAALRTWGFFDRGEFFKAHEQEMFRGNSAAYLNANVPDLCGMQVDPNSTDIAGKERPESASQSGRGVSGYAGETR